MNLGRLIQTTRCSNNDQTFCLLDGSLLVQSEICGGILVATLPRLGPLFQKTQNDSSRPLYQPQTPGAVTPYGRLPSFGSRPLRSKKLKSNWNEFGDDSLLRTQDENTGVPTTWQPHVPGTVSLTQPASVLEPQGTNGNGIGYYWSAKTSGTHGQENRLSGGAGIPRGEILRKTEFTNEWLAR